MLFRSDPSRTHTFPKRRRDRRNTKTAIGIGPYVRLYSEDYFYEAFSKVGLSFNAFRALMRNLSVPHIEIGRTRYFDLMTVSIAFRAILRIGSPSFLAPGSYRRNKLSVARLASLHLAASLSPSSLRSDLRGILCEIIACRHNPKLIQADYVRKAAERAASSLELWGFATLAASEQGKLIEDVIRAAELPNPQDTEPFGPPPKLTGSGPNTRIPTIRERGPQQKPAQEDGRPPQPR